MKVSDELELPFDILMKNDEFKNIWVAPVGHRCFPENFAKNLVKVVPLSNNELRNIYKNPGKQERLNKKGRRNVKKFRTQ